MLLIQKLAPDCQNVCIALMVAEYV